MIADSKIPEMPLKVLLKSSHALPTFLLLAEVILSWTRSHSPPTFLLLTEVILSWTRSHAPPTFLLLAERYILL